MTRFFRGPPLDQMRPLGWCRPAASTPAPGPGLPLRDDPLGCCLAGVKPARLARRGLERFVGALLAQPCGRVAPVVWMPAQATAAPLPPHQWPGGTRQLRSGIGALGRPGQSGETHQCFGWRFDAAHLHAPKSLSRWPRRSWSPAWGETGPAAAARPPSGPWQATSEATPQSQVTSSVIIGHF